MCHDPRAVANAARFDAYASLLLCELRAVVFASSRTDLSGQNSHFQEAAARLASTPSLRSATTQQYGRPASASAPPTSIKPRHRAEPPGSESGTMSRSSSMESLTGTTSAAPKTASKRPSAPEEAGQGQGKGTKKQVKEKRNRKQNATKFSKRRGVDVPELHDPAGKRERALGPALACSASWFSHY